MVAEGPPDDWQGRREPGVLEYAGDGERP